MFLMKIKKGEDLMNAVLKEKYYEIAEKSDAAAAVCARACEAFCQETDPIRKAELLKEWQNVHKIHIELWEIYRKAWIEYETSWEENEKY